MALTTATTEITTSITDAIIAVECIVILFFLWRDASGNRWKAGLWCWVFGLLSFASFLGAIAHGIPIPPIINNFIWKPLYLSLGLVVSLFLVGVFFDWHGRDVAKRIMPWSVAIGISFYILTEVIDGVFMVFVVYEAVVMVTSLAIYIYLAKTNRVKGAGIIATAIFLNLIAAGVQASPLTLRIIVPFDHNGIFHLVEMVGIAVLGKGLHLSMKPYLNSQLFKNSHERV